MDKIVVTTDFSANSKKGILFALQLATQTNCELIFYNVVTIFRPSIWDNVYYAQFEMDELKRSQILIDKFIKRILHQNKISKINYKCVCEVGMVASNQIIEYAKTNNAKYICVSTIGLGKLSQLFGTTASQLIAFSPTPVLIVPKNYRVKPINSLFFASDFKNFEEEFKKIEKFVIPLEAKLNVYHYDYNSFFEINKNKFNKLINNHETKKIKFHLRPLDSGTSLLSHLESDISKAKPSIVVLFTKQNRNWFSRLFLSSLSVELAFDTKTPMLVFKKYIT
ncbi:universal stress protein [Flavobacterium sp.]|uniref:universal stress protein n=1 Tax=Flavobacterium sp. TaxID=239 RepID=UPI00286E8250|nr:universal stress protein [Flavobacterium sp.]